MREDEAGSEAVLFPDLRICDAHVHLWTRTGQTPPSSNGTWDATGRIPYEPADLADTIRASGHNVRSVIFAECGQGFRHDVQEEFMPVGETEYVVEAREELRASGGPDIAAMFGIADLTGPHLDQVLDAHIEAGKGVFAGVRVRAAHDPDRAEFQPNANQPPGDLMQSDRFRRGIARLGERGLKADIWLFHPQLRDFRDLARKTPDTGFVINHLGGPLGVGRHAAARSEMLASWCADMLALAELPNVWVKLGGFGMYLLGHSWRGRIPSASEAEIEGFYGDMTRFLIDSFGPERCMFESNFPVDRSSFSYGTFWNACKRLTMPYTDSEREWLCERTALHFYTGAPQLNVSSDQG